MGPADTEVIPEKRDYKSVPYFGGKKLKSGGKIKTKVGNYGGNSGSEDGVWKKTVDEVTENPKIFKFQTKSMPKTQTKSSNISQEIYQLEISEWVKMKYPNIYPHSEIYDLGKKMNPRPRSSHKFLLALLRPRLTR